jgi:hypothetical protein
MGGDDTMTNSAANIRNNVRAKLHLPVLLTGADREGRPFRIAGESSDFSRKGLGVILDQDALTPGLLVTVSSGGRFRANATVQWIGRDRDTGRIHVGLRVVEAKTSIGLKIAASLLLSFAYLSQGSFGQSRQFTRAAPPQTSASQTQQSQPVSYPPGVGTVRSRGASSASRATATEPEEGNWIEQAIVKAAESKPNGRKAAIDIRMSKESYGAGETVAASGYRLSNPSHSSQSVELKTWMSAAGVNPISVGNVGADGLYVLPPGLDEEYGPVDLSVSAGMLGGKAQFSARILDPVTGEIVGETVKSFTLAPSSEKSPQVRNDRMPSLLVDCHVTSSRYRSGETVSLASYRIINQGASPATIEAKVWLEAPSLNPIAVFSLGADGSLVMTPGSYLELQPLDPFKVTENLPAGTYVLKSRVLDPVTGEVFNETDTSFEIH